MKIKLLSSVILSLLILNILVPVVSATDTTTPFSVSASYNDGIVSIVGNVDSDYYEGTVTFDIDDSIGSSISVAVTDINNEGVYAVNVNIGEVSFGQYTVHAYCNKVNQVVMHTQCTFMVSQSSLINVDGVTLNVQQLSMKVGDTETLIATITPINATNKNLLWSSEDTSVVTVSDVGLVTAISVGESRIIVTTADGSYTSICTVTIAIQSNTMLISDSSIKLYLDGEDSALLSVELPIGYDSSSVVWSSSNSSIAKVKGISTGVSSVTIEGVGSGSVTITARTYDGAYSVSCTVIVSSFSSQQCTTYYFFIQFEEGYDKTTLTSVSEEDMKNGFWVTGIGDNAALALEYVCSTNNWDLSFDNTYYAGWFNTFLGLKTISNSDGTYTYWVQYHKSTESGIWEYNQKCLGYLNTMESQYIKLVYSTTSEMIEEIKVTGVSLDKTSAILNVGDLQILTAIILPDNATNKNVTWSSSNTSVATVDSNGKVTAVSNGTSVITVTTDNGNFKATCTVTVGNTTVAVTGVSLSSSSVTLTSDTEVLTATVSPGNATNRNVTWSSSNTSVVTVSNGVLTPVSAGTAVVTVTTEDGRFTATCSVTVKAVKAVDLSVTPVTDNDGNTSAKITDDQIASAVKSIKGSAGGDSKPVVTADISVGGSSGSSALTVSSSALKDLADVSADLRIVTDRGTVSLDPETLASLSAEGDGDVVIAVADVDVGTLTDEQKEKVGDGLVVSFNVTVGNNAVHELGGTVSVTVPYELEDGQDASQVTVWYMDDEGNMDSVSCSYDSVNKTVRFTTDHFSYFVIGYGVSVDDGAGAPGADYTLAVAIIAIALILAGIGAYMYRRSRGAE